jgi:Ribosomal protein S1
MALETGISKESNTKEFENLLNEDFKKRDFKEGKIIKATVSEIGKKYVFVETGLKSEGAIPIDEFKISKELEKLKVGSKIDVYLEKIESYKGEIVVSREKAKRMGSWEKMNKALKLKKKLKV